MNHLGAFRRSCTLLLLGLSLLCASAFANDKVFDASQLGDEPVSLTEYFAVLEDPNQSLTLADVQDPVNADRFKSGHAPAVSLNFGYSPSAHWLRLTLRNTNALPVQRMLEISYARLSFIELHLPQANGAYLLQSTGSARPFASRPHKNRFFVFPVSLPAHSEQTYFLRVQSTAAVIVPARLWAQEAFQTNERNDYFVQAWYFGIATAMVLFNLLLFVVLREMVYLFYVASVALMATSLAASYGLAKEFLWPDATEWSNISSSVGYSLTIVAAVLFMRLMLSTWKFTPRIDRWLKGLIVVHGFLLSGLVANYSTFARYAAIVFVVSLLLMMGAGLYCAFRRQRSAYFFVAAFAVLFFTGVINALASLGVLPANGATHNTMQFGSAAEMLLLAIALGDRFNQTRREKELAQKKILESQNMLVKTLQESERLLESRVTERTEELLVLNQKLETLSITDSLTGISNRRRFDTVLEEEWLRAQRAGLSLAVAIMDVDWFKKFNDLYGHPAGDACLQTVAKVLSTQVCRTGDLVARYGGEEFVFISPVTDTEAAIGMAERVRAAVIALAQAHEGSDFGFVTLSIGVAAAVPGRDQHDQSGTDLLKRADAALYRAKTGGRNRVVAG